MTTGELTCQGSNAKIPTMHGRPLAGCGKAVVATSAALLAGASLGGCVSVTAPDKPIVIELNVNIKQEVIYRLADDVTKNIESNPEIF